jgi:hypothetical protein
MNWAKAVCAALGAAIVLAGCQQSERDAERPLAAQAPVSYDTSSLAQALAQFEAGNKPSTPGVQDDALSRAFDSAEADVEKSYQPSPWFKAKVKDAILKMMDRLMTQCFDAPGKEAQAVCFHDRMLVGFDRDGTVGDHCPTRADASDDMSCIMFGGMGYQLASKIGADAATSFDWTKPEQAARSAFKELALQQVRDCLCGGSSSDVFDCYIEGITKALDISNADLDPCTEFKDDDVKFGNCVGEVYCYKYMTAGVERM